MHHEQVAWLEGMFLRPHHMQAAERSSAELIGSQVHLDHGYSYGVRRIDFSKEAIANGQFELSECQARLRDGTVVWISIGQEPNRVELGAKSQISTKDLSSAFEQDEAIDVYIAVPKLRLGRANSLTERGGEHRYVTLASSVPDENGGGNEQEIQQRALNVQLLLGTENLAGYETLRIARIKRSGATEAAPELDADYIPPVLACDAWSELKRYVRDVYDIIGQKIEVLSAQVNSRGIMQGALEAGDINRLLMLTALNTGFGSLRSLAFATGVHPLVAYTELCRIVGSLSIFRSDRSPGEIPLYDHDDLGRIFRWVREEIRSLITEVEEYKYEREDFIGAEGRLEAMLTQKWLGHGWDWFIGVEYQHITAQECRDLLKPGRLEWKLGPSQRVEFMWKYKVPDLDISETPAPRALPQGDNWIFFSVDRRGPVWNQLQSQDPPALGIKFNENLIENLKSLHGQKDLDFRVGELRGTLRLSLFAVPTG